MDRQQTAAQIIDMFHILKKSLIRYASHRVKQKISPMQLHVMFSMQEKDHFTMSELASVVLISKQQLTPIIDKLVGAGLVLRETDEADRRVVKIRLSPEGKAFLAAHLQDVVRVFDTKLAALSGEELKRLGAMLTELQQLLRKLP